MARARKPQRLRREVTKLNLSKEVITSICAEHHMRKWVYSDKIFKETSIELDRPTYDKIRNIARTLRVSIDAVISGLLLEFIEEEEGSHD